MNRRPQNLQDFDAEDLFGNAYDAASRPLMIGARYGWVIDSDGIPRFRQVDYTRGPIGGWVCWPGIGGEGGRVLAQWAQVFPAKITTASPLKATPIEYAAAGVPTVATDLGELTVSTLDGTSPAVGTFGLVVVGTELDDQNPIFFQGGGGASSKVYRITVNNADGTYSGQEVDYPSGTDLGDPLETLSELNHSIDVPVGEFVEGTVRGDGRTWFSMPFGCTT